VAFVAESPRQFKPVFRMTHRRNYRTQSHYQGAHSSKFAEFPSIHRFPKKS
jgi:hypothetical protein